MPFAALAAPRREFQQDLLSMTFSDFEALPFHPADGSLWLAGTSPHECLSANLKLSASSYDLQLDKLARWPAPGHIEWSTKRSRLRCRTRGGRASIQCTDLAKPQLRSGQAIS